MVSKVKNEKLDIEDEVVKKKKKVAKSKKATISEFALEQENQLIAQEAYYLSEKRGFAPGHELEDWLEAEKIIKSYFI